MKTDGSNEEQPAEAIARVRTIVKHLGDMWPIVLRRRTYMLAMGQREDLRDGLAQTYAAHVQNDLQDVLLIDLIREIGALVLDRFQDSASVAVAVAILRDPNVVKELETEYRVVPPVRLYNEDDLDEETLAQVRKSIHDNELKRNLEQLAELPAFLDEIDRTLLQTDVSKAIRTARNKAVAHYDVIRDGSDWKMWRIGATGLTYGQLDEYVAATTSTIDKLCHFVRRTAFDFKGAEGIAHKYATVYIDALVIGLRSQRSDRDAKLAELQRSMQTLETEPAKRGSDGRS